MGAVVENKLARAATMLTNGADELRSNLGKARGSIARAGSASVPVRDVGDVGRGPAHGRRGGLDGLTIRRVPVRGTAG